MRPPSFFAAIKSHRVTSRFGTRPSSRQKERKWSSLSLKQGGRGGGGEGGGHTLTPILNTAILQKEKKCSVLLKQGIQLCFSKRVQIKKKNSKKLSALSVLFEPTPLFLFCFISLYLFLVYINAFT